MPDNAQMPKRRWLPLKELFGVVNQVNVSLELHRVLADDRRDKIESYAKRICESVQYQDRNGRDKISSRRSLFAILTLMGETACAPQLLETGLLDKDLPLKSRDGKLAGFTDDENKWSIGVRWDARTCDLFSEYQECMISPFFKLLGEDVPFYDLHVSAVLPFIEQRFPDEKTQSHHGSVSCIKIHPAHHDMHDVSLIHFFRVLFPFFFSFSFSPVVSYIASHRTAGRTRTLP